MTTLRHIARTLVNASAWSWIVFSLLEVWRPTTVTRLFSPHWFAAALVVGIVFLYRASAKNAPPR